MAERDIERNLIYFLSGNKGYDFIDIHNTEELERNLLQQLSKLNGNVELTQLDLADIKHYLFDTLNGEYAYNFNSKLYKSIPLRNRKEGKVRTIRIMSASASENIYQVAHQIRDESNSALARYDVTILINGIPMVQIELKRQDVEIAAAVNQLNRYIRTAFNDWFKLLQLIVVSNETNTRYTVNNNDRISKQFMFRWSDEQNNAIDDLYKFADTFLDKNNLHEVISNYMVRRNSYGHKSLVVMRPYQIYAVKAVMTKLKKPYNELNRVANNGYIFHTTGSGKTLTSFKCVQMAASMPSISRVIFLVDRRDLDAQTTEEFKSIESGLDIDETDSTKQLLKSFKNKSNKITITTIQKLSRAVQKANNEDGEYSKVFGEYQDKDIVFIVDECHRTQFGDMHLAITKFFRKSRFIGFTGTPIFNENATVPGRTTQSLFNQELHSYRIDCAIKDKNVLGFSVDYHNTIKTDNKALMSLSDYATSETRSIDTDELFGNKVRITGIVNKIFDIHNKKTVNRKYTALFAVDSIPMLLKYYNEFKVQNSNKSDEDKLRVSAIFTASDAEADEFGSYRDKLMEIMSDFNSEFSINCEDETGFRAELTKSLKAIREPHLDIVIVVNIFLTGFDSKMTNTLYIDKNLEYHGLLQAFSRTNRVESELKPFGNIVCFRPLKTNVDNAIRLFNQNHKNSTLIAKSYENCLNRLLEIIDEVNKIPGITQNFEWSTDNEKVNFVTKMRQLNRALTEVKQFDEFSWDVISDKLTFDKYNVLIGQLKELASDIGDGKKDKESILPFVDFCMELVESDRIDIEYIRNLIANIDISSDESFAVSINGLREVLDKSTSDTVIYKKELIKKFLDKLVEKKRAGQISPSTNIESEFRGFVESEKRKDIKEQSMDSGLTPEYLEQTIIQSEVIGKINKESLGKSIKEKNENLGFRKRRAIQDAVINWVKSFKNKFNGIV